MNNKLRDDVHRLSIVVTPLQPPFDDGVVILSFDGEDQKLALSSADAEAIEFLLQNHAAGCEIVLSPEGDKIRVTVQQ